MESLKQSQSRLESLEKEVVEIQTQMDLCIANKDKEKHIALSKRLKQIKKEIEEIERFCVNVGDGVTICKYSDRVACTVIRRTNKTIIVQRDKVTLDPNFEPKFDGLYCINNNFQRYIYERDENGATYTFRWNEKKKAFKECGTNEYIINGRHEFYDYNF